MASVDAQAVFALSPAAAFAALADLPRRPALDPTVGSIEAPAFVPEAGAAFSGWASLTGSDEAFEGSITAYEPDSFLAIGFAFGSGARFHEEWRLSATASGTLARYRADLRLPGGFVGKLLDRVMVGGGFRKQREAVLLRIKAGLETGGPHSP
ncbi:MAG TPA: SRPBCC family protein [Dehalococcoidia bacterium]|nr:SRPBCC family protein [Dehalococcoidia bacterium]